MKTIRKTIAALMILLLMISALPVRTKAETTDGSESLVSKESASSDGDAGQGEASDPINLPEEEKDSGTDRGPENTLGEASDQQNEDPVRPEEIKEGPEEETAEKVDSTAVEETKEEDEIELTEGTEEVKDDVPQTDVGQVSEVEDIGEVEGGYTSMEGEDGEGEGDKAEPQDKEEPEIYSLTLVLCDIRDDVKVFRNGERVGWIYGNPSPEDGSFFIAGKKGPEELKKESDGTTRVTFEALSGDVFLIEAMRPSYAVVRFTNADKIREFNTDKLCDFTAEINADTWVLMDAEYSETADKTELPVKK